jgi:hypothetical protein
MKKILTTIFAATIALCAIAAPKTYVALSPDGKLKVNVTEGKDIAYTLTYDGTQLISAIGDIHDPGMTVRSMAGQ